MVMLAVLNLYMAEIDPPIGWSQASILAVTAAGKRVILLGNYVDGSSCLSMTDQTFPSADIPLEK